MDEPRILVCDSIHGEGVEMLRAAGYTVDLETSISNQELVEAVRGYDAIVVRSRTKVTKKVLEAGKRLKAVGRAGVGLDNIDLVTANRLSIEVVNSPEAPTNAVAELVLGLMLSLARRIPEADYSMKKGEWIKGQLTGIELEGRILGIIGFGRIGYRLAVKARALGMSVLTYDVRIDELRGFVDDAGAEAVTLDKLLGSSDFVTIHVPLLHQTRHMIGVKEIDAMKESAYLINAARGGVVDEKALEDGLRCGKLAGAAMDVFEVEPQVNVSLTSLPNVVSLPHIGASTVEAQKANSRIVAEKLIKIFGLTY